MQKVVCLIESLGSGGAERQMSGLAVLLKQQGLDVEVWTYYPNDFYLPTLQTAGVKYRYIAQAQPQKKRISVLRRELLGAAPDTVIAYLDQACIVACIVKMLGAKFNLIVSERNTTQKLTFRERLKFFFYRFADYIVPNSHTQTRFIAKHYPHLQKKLRCITNFVDTEKFCPAQVKESNDPLQILTVARIMPQKNVINYIKAIKRLVCNGIDNFTIKWVGQSLGDLYYSECIQCVKDNKLEEYIEFIPQNSNVINYYQNADIFCLPSIYEGFPNVVCEAMSCGMPILCADVCDNPIIVENGINGLLFNPADVEDIYIKMRQMLTNKSLLSYREINRAKAIEMFSKNRLLSSYLELL